MNADIENFKSIDEILSQIDNACDCKDQALMLIANKIIIEHKHAFEVLAND